MGSPQEEAYGTRYTCDVHAYDTFYTFNIQHTRPQTDYALLKLMIEDLCDESIYDTVGKCSELRYIKKVPSPVDNIPHLIEARLKDVRYTHGPATLRFWPMENGQMVFMGEHFLVNTGAVGAIFSIIRKVTGIQVQVSYWPDLIGTFARGKIQTNEVDARNFYERHNVNSGKKYKYHGWVVLVKQNQTSQLAIGPDNNFVFYTKEGILTMATIVQRCKELIEQ